MFFINVEVVAVHISHAGLGGAEATPMLYWGGWPPPPLLIFFFKFFINFDFNLNLFIKKIIKYL